MVLPSDSLVTVMCPSSPHLLSHPRGQRRASLTSKGSTSSCDGYGSPLLLPHHPKNLGVLHRSSVAVKVACWHLVRCQNCLRAYISPRCIDKDVYTTERESPLLGSLACCCCSCTSVSGTAYVSTGYIFGTAT